ncbi:hypothetical protein N0V84_009554 [Fusarium piperis]|uniref:Uncharacterized protein n=1 Tax=Fusarium piperis TaxID=1435070 RepID=A0A9W9BIH4_9HYPO|nr:hypothetical protein N0V84_009554 [Fusarium piperis]
MIRNLEEWSVTARDRNLTWRDETEWEEWPATSFSPNRMAEGSRTHKYANQKTQDEGKGILARIKGWANGVLALSEPGHDIKQLREMLQGRFSHQLRDVVQGIQAVSGICDELSTFSSLVNGLHSPANWIATGGKSTVLLKKIAHPKDQAKALNSLQQELTRHLGVLD